MSEAAPRSRWILKAAVAALLLLSIALYALVWKGSDSHPQTVDVVDVASNKSTTPLNSASDLTAPTLAGIVVDSTGVAVAKAHIVVYQNGNQVSTATTNDVGHFSAWAPPGAVAVVGTATGYQDASVQSFAPASDIVLTMFVGFRVGGQVLFEQSRKPAANIKVTATRNSAGIANAQDKSAITDAEGRFVFDGLPLGRMVFGVNASHLSGRTAVDITATPAVADIKVLVQEGRTVTGRFVIDATNAPCSKGTIQIIPKELIDSSGRVNMDAIVNITSEDVHRPVTTGAALTENGAVELPAVIPGRYTVLANCDDYERVSGPRELDIRADDMPNQEWRFQPSLSLDVHVVDENNTDVESIQIALKPKTVSAGALNSASDNPYASDATLGRTNQRGEYRFSQLNPGQYEVIARMSGGRQPVEATQVVDVQRSANNQQLTLQLPAIGAIDVHVHTADNHSVSQLLLYAIDALGRRFEGNEVGSGNYSIKPLPRGLYRVYAYDNKNPQLPVPGSSGDIVQIDSAQSTKLDLLYEPPQAAITGVVTDVNGAPVEAAVQAVSTKLDERDEKYAGIQTARHGEQYRTTDSQGHFKIDGLVVNGAYKIFVQSRDGRKVEKANVLSGQYVQIAMPALGSISGTVVTQSGTPITDFVVTLENHAVGEERTEQFHGGGAFRFDKINSGTLQLFAVSPVHHLQGSATVTLAAGEARSGVRITLNEAPNDD